MATEPTDTGPRPNPYRDAGPFGVVEIGGVVVPGILQSIDGCDVKNEWNFQKAGGGGAAANEANADPANAGTTPAATGTVAQTAGSFGVSVWRGALLAEEITITTDVSRAQAWDDMLDFIQVLMPKRGKKPPSHSLVNPCANLVGIARCSLRGLAIPNEDKPGSGKRLFTFKVCEYNPKKTAAAGKADPAKPGADPKPADAGEKELKDLMDKARA